jgi:O-methyltransferase
MISSIKPILRRLRARLPSFMQTAIYRLRFAIQHPKLVSALDAYTYTDEHLKFVHILEAINYVRVAGAAGKVLPQTYFEFGCHSGRTFSAAVNAASFFKMNNAEFYAFDSFEGLPETDADEDGYFQSGTFCTGRAEFVEIVKKKTGLRLADNHIVEGYYCDSLTPQLQTQLPKAGVVHIDVDLYSSTVEVLNFIRPLLVAGTLLIFDDWYCFPPGANKGELRAVKEFCEANPLLKLREWKAYSTFGQSFIVTDIS